MPCREHNECLAGNVTSSGKNKERTGEETHIQGRDRTFSFHVEKMFTVFAGYLKPNLNLNEVDRLFQFILEVKKRKHKESNVISLWQATPHANLSHQ